MTNDGQRGGHEATHNDDNSQCERIMAQRLTFETR